MNDLTEIYKNEMTENGLADLRIKYPASLVVDMSDEQAFKDARKTRTECNKLVESLNRRRIDKTNEIKSIGDGLVESVIGIYSVIVDPFEKELAKRKADEKKKADEQKALIDGDREKIKRFRGFVSEAHRSNSENISSLIDSLTNIDCSNFHKELIHEAIETREQVLTELTSLLSNKLQLEESERERLEMKAKIDAMEAKERELKKTEVEIIEESTQDEKVAKEYQEPEKNTVIPLTNRELWLMNEAFKAGQEFHSETIEKWLKEPVLDSGQIVKDLLMLDAMLVKN